MKSKKAKRKLRVFAKTEVKIKGERNSGRWKVPDKWTTEALTHTQEDRFRFTGSVWLEQDWGIRRMYAGMIS